MLTNDEKPAEGYLEQKKRKEKLISFLIPRFGVFTNGLYDIKGCIWFGRCFGFISGSRYNSVANVGDWKNWRQYNSKTDLTPQFKRK
jgi:hypothetical protein